MGGETIEPSHIAGYAPRQNLSIFFNDSIVSWAKHQVDRLGGEPPKYSEYFFWETAALTPEGNELLPSK